MSIELNRKPRQRFTTDIPWASYAGRPCPAHVTTELGKRLYCEVGPEGHWGTHIGARDRSEYVALTEACS